MLFVVLLSIIFSVVGLSFGLWLKWICYWFCVVLKFKVVIVLLLSCGISVLSDDCIVVMLFSRGLVGVVLGVFVVFFNDMRSRYSKVNDLKI